MSTTALQAPARRPLRLPSSWSPRLFLSELLLKQWFEPIIPFTVMIVLRALFLADDQGLRARLANALSLMRLFAEFGFVALGMAFSLISGGIDLSVGANLRVVQFRGVVFSVRARFPGLAGRSGDAGHRRRHRRRQRLSDRLSESAAVPHDAGDADHPARQRQSPRRALRHGVRHQFGRQRRLGLSRRRQHPWRAGQRGDADRRASHRPRLSQPLALWLASHRDRRQPQSGAPCRHPRRAHAAGDLHALRRCSAPPAASSTPRARAARIRPPASAGNSRR